MAETLHPCGEGASISERVGGALRVRIHPHPTLPHQGGGSQSIQPRERLGYFSGLSVTVACSVSFCATDTASPESVAAPIAAAGAAAIASRIMG